MMVIWSTEEPWVIEAVIAAIVKTTPPPWRICIIVESQIVHTAIERVISQSVETVAGHAVHTSHPVAAIGVGWHVVPRVAVTTAAIEIAVTPASTVIWTECSVWTVVGPRSTPENAVYLEP